MINIAALDDEQEIISEYEKKIPYFIEKNKIEGKLVIATTSPAKFLDTVKSGSISLCIIDIDLATNTNGMNIAKQIRDEGVPCEIVFMTSHVEYVYEAFDVQAYNFVQKPNFDKLESIIVKIANEKEKLNGKKVLSIKCGSEIFFINYDDICYIDHIGTKTNIYTNKNEQYQTYEGLEELMIRLDDVRFKRFHRSIFVNIDYIDKIDITSKEMKLLNGYVFKIGPKYYSSIDWRKA